jgi:hypothetical protein
MPNRPPRTPATDEGAERRDRWRRWLDDQLTQRGINNAEFTRLLNRPSFTKDMVTRWRNGQSGASPNAAIRIAQIFELPATHVLHEAGHDDIAAYIEDVAGPAGTDAAALEPLIARVRALTQGLTSEQRTALEHDLLDQAANWFLLTEVKAARLLRTTQETSDERGVS